VSRSWRRRTTIGAEPVTIEAYRGSRIDLLPLFSRADDSAAAIRLYLNRGDVLVARIARRIVGHVQLVAAGAEWEITSVAVLERHERQGIGAALVRAARDRAFAAGATQVLVAAATADVGSLRFYQRLGFRMDRVERDVFTAERGYPALEVDGIPVRDRVWFSTRTP
jgi:ribosomal protein S18 acetylase RimI-like enzyme